MTLAVVGTLSTNKQSNKQKETQNTHILRDNKYGSEFWVKNGFQGSEKKKHVIVVSEDTKSIK